jgi:arylsulfatase A-like enzyme
LDPADYNIVLVSIDTLRADHLSLYGYERETSPNLDRLAGESVVFDSMVNSGGFTLPVHMSMMTSLPPFVHNVLPNNQRVLEPERITLAEQLQEVGIRTAGFTDAGYVIDRFGFGQGFDVFDDSGGRLKTILPKALTWLDENRKDQFFLFMHTYDVHFQFGQHAYDCPGDYPQRYAFDYSGDFTGCIDGKCASELMVWLYEQLLNDPTFELEQYLDADDLAYVMARYDGCINYVDDMVALLIDRLRELGVYDRTMIIITSDHGEEFMDHGLLGHGNAPYEVMVHVPLLIKFPESAHAGQRVGGLATTIDLMPTVLDVLGIPPNDQVEGISLLPLVVEGTPNRDSTHLMFNAMRTERWKYLKWKEEDFLFDLAKDPGEAVNLAAALPSVAKRLEKDVQRRMKGERVRFEGFVAGIQQQPEQPQLTEKEIRVLRALGYLD